MKLCNYLFTALNFEPSCISPCCDVRRAGVPSFPFSGEALDLERYFRSVFAFFMELQNDSTPCEGCPELRTTLAPLPENYTIGLKISSISVNHHRFFCNCRCVYCDLWHPKQAAASPRPYAILPTLQQLAASRVLSAHPSISWGGGEPTILDEFEQTGVWALENGFHQYVHTNALRYSPAVARILSRGEGMVNVSLDSHDAASYRKIKGVDGWGAVMETLKAYVAASGAGQGAGQGVELKYIIFDSTNNLRDIQHFFALCQSLGVTRVLYSLNFCEINANAISEKTLYAGAFFRQMAKKCGMTANPFYLTANLMEQLDEFEKRLGE